MDTYHVERRDRAEAERLLRQPVPDLQPDPIRAPATVYDQATGESLVVVARYEGDMGALRRAFMVWPMSTTMRALGIRIRSTVFGNLSRRVHMKREGCRVCYGDAINPAAHRQILDAGRSMAGSVPWWRNLERVRLMRMAGRPGGGRLARHSDVTDRNAGTRDGAICRFHIPIATAPAITMTTWDLDGTATSHHLPPWSCWYLDQRKPHAVTNPTVTDRIHLVVDVVADREVRARLLEAA